MSRITDPNNPKFLTQSPTKPAILNRPKKKNKRKAQKAARKKNRS